MSKSSFRLEGAEALDRKIGGFADLAKDKPAVVSVLTDALQPIADDAASMAPKRTGNLSREIVVSEHSIFEGDDTGAYAAAYVGPTMKAFYGYEVENGRPGGEGLPAAAPQPFMRPAWDGGSDAVLPRVADGLAKLINSKG